MRRRRKSPCFGKKRYTNLIDVRKKIILNYLHNKNAYGYYTCPFCLDFHLTSKHGEPPKIKSEELHTILKLQLTKNLVQGRMSAIAIPKRKKRFMNMLPLKKQKEALAKLHKKGWQFWK